jgi:hypothetical protein
LLRLEAGIARRFDQDFKPLIVIRLESAGNARL